MSEPNPEEQRLMVLGRLQAQIVNVAEWVEAEDRAAEQLYTLAENQPDVKVRNYLVKVATEAQSTAASNRKWLGDLQERLTRMEAES